MEWFKHDSDAHQDAKLIKLKMRYGMEGYGLYWHCLELISGSIDKSNVTFQLEHDAEVISYQVGLHQDKVEQIMRYMVELKLFEDNLGAITCMKMAIRLDQSMTSNKLLRMKISEFKENNHDEVMTHHDEVMKDKIRIDKNRIDKNQDIVEQSPTRKRFSIPSIEEIQQHMESLPNSLPLELAKTESIKFFNFYDSKNWMVGKNKMSNWKSAVTGWVNRMKDNKQFSKSQPLTMSDMVGEDSWKD